MQSVALRFSPLCGICYMLVTHSLRAYFHEFTRHNAEGIFLFHFQGQEFAEFYMLEYQREDGGDWKKFTDRRDKDVSIDQRCTYVYMIYWIRILLPFKFTLVIGAFCQITSSTGKSAFVYVS